MITRAIRLLLASGFLAAVAHVAPVAERAALGITRARPGARGDCPPLGQDSSRCQALSPARKPGSLPCSSGVRSRSSTWPLAISTTSLAAWLKSRGRIGCLVITWASPISALPNTQTRTPPFQGRKNEHPLRLRTLHLRYQQVSREQRQEIGFSMMNRWYGRFQGYVVSVGTNFFGVQ
jgi:hypothetical protein